MTPELLRRAIGDVEACRAMTSPASEMVRAEYFSARARRGRHGPTWPKMSDSGPYSSTNWYSQLYGGRWAHRFIRHEPERSARVLRLIAAGYLAQCDRPRADRPRLLFADSMIYAHDDRTPGAVRAIAPEALESWYRDSFLRDLGPFGNTIQGYADTESSTFDDLALKMAERAFALERGRPARRVRRTARRLLEGAARRSRSGGPGGPGLGVIRPRLSCRTRPFHTPPSAPFG